MGRRGMGGIATRLSWKMLGLGDPPLLGRAQYDITREQRATRQRRRSRSHEPRECGSGGSRRGGGIVAKELAVAGLSVVLLERGKWYTAADCRKDDLRNQRNTQLGNAFGPEDKGNPRVWVDAKGAAHIGGGERWRLLKQRGVRGRRNAELGRAGMAVHAAGLQDAHRPMERRREVRWRTGPFRMTILSRSTTRPSMRLASQATTAARRFTRRESGRCRCRRCRRIANSGFWSRRRSGLGFIRCTFRWRATAFPTTAAAPACAAAGAWGLCARWTRRTDRRTL